MISTSKKRMGIAFAGIALLGTMAMAAPLASALPYAHSEAQAQATGGVVHIAVTVDCKAIGGSVKAVWLPICQSDASVDAVLNEFLYASENKVDRFAHEDYAMISLGEFLEDKTYTVEVFKNGAQRPGATAVYTSAVAGDATYTGLETGDGVYITVTE